MAVESRELNQSLPRETLNKYLLVAEGVHNTGFYADRSVRATLNQNLQVIARGDRRWPTRIEDQAGEV